MARLPINKGPLGDFIGKGVVVASLEKEWFEKL